MKHGLYFPPVGQLADPAALVEIAVAAEESGWDGLFLWDHVLRASGEPGPIADPWICLALIAHATDRLRIGPMVTPITRRRPIKLVREAVSIDHLSAGRLTLGLGLGVDSYGELTKFDEIVEPAVRGRRLDEGVEILCRLFTGDRVDYVGEHFVARDVLAEPASVQQPRPPLWFAARGDAHRPVRRAARFDGLFPVDVDLAQLRRMLDTILGIRDTLDGFDVALRPNAQIRYEQLPSLGVTWAMSTHAPGSTLGDVRAWAEAPPEVAFSTG